MIEKPQTPIIRTPSTKKGNLFMNLKFNKNTQDCQVKTDILLEDNAGFEEKQRMTPEQWNQYASSRGLPLQTITANEVQRNTLILLIIHFSWELV